jgi:hypothetical protein
LLAEAYIPALGIGGWWTLFVLTLHTVWSVSVPIAVTEAIFASRRETPWLGKLGLGVVTFLFLAGAVMIHFGTRKQDPFFASPIQLATVCLITVVVIVVALRFRKKAAADSRPVPGSWLIGVATFLLGLGFMSGHRAIHGWSLVAVYLVLYIIGFGILAVWSKRSAWTPIHTLAAAAGAMITYACTAFPQEPVIGAKGPVDLVGNTIFALVALALLYLAVRSERAALKE